MKGKRFWVIVIASIRYLVSDVITSILQSLKSPERKDDQTSPRPLYGINLIIRSYELHGYIYVAPSQAKSIRDEMKLGVDWNNLPKMPMEYGFSLRVFELRQFCLFLTKIFNAFVIRVKWKRCQIVNKGLIIDFLYGCFKNCLLQLEFICSRFQ